jgi:hypothetical protein
MSWLPLSQRTLLLEDGRVRADVPTSNVRSGPPPARAAATSVGDGGAA